ncbi:MAG: hypothetical protein JWL72_2006 [Ilumatobacteraceae bacterium]|nr:hypothetical protein [Ilumatobacteraceae bacterium]
MSARRNELALLVAHRTPRRKPGRFAIHIVNVGVVSARAASWRVEGPSSSPTRLDNLVQDLPGEIAPGDDITVATVEPDEVRDPMHVVLRWVQPSGMVDESSQMIQ